MCFNISCPNLENNDYCNSHLRKLFNIDTKNYLKKIDICDPALYSAECYRGSKSCQFSVIIGYYNFQYLKKKRTLDNTLLICSLVCLMDF